jgi:hypothetical protein
MADAHRESKGVSSFKAGPEGEMAQLVVTINPAMGRIVSVEKIDNAGKHQECAEEEWSQLVGEDEVEDIDVALEEAFEAGIAAVLGEEYEEDESYEDDEEKALRRFLIRGLMRHRPVQRRILQRVLVSRLLRRRSLKRPARQ